MATNGAELTNLLLADHTDLLQAFTALVDDLQANGIVT